MKIAIDVHSIGKRAGGNETYFRLLVHGLEQEKSDHQYTLFFTDPAARRKTVSDPRFDPILVPGNPLVRNLVSLPLLLKEVAPDVFHCQYIKPPLITVKTVVTIHDLAHEHYPEFSPPLERLRMRTLVRSTARSADHIVTVSKFCADDIARTYGVPPEKITFTYLSASEQFHPRDRQLCREHLARQYGIEFPFILYVGRIQARKNLPRLIEAYALLRRRGITARLTMVGNFDWRAEQLHAKIRELQLEQSIIFPGYIAGDDLPLFYNAAELFVFPSIFEGFGLPVIESMASGTPTVTSLGSSLEEVAGDAALLADPLDVNSIADKMERVLEDGNLQRQLIERGLQRSVAFKTDDLASKMLAVYELVAGRIR